MARFRKEIKDSPGSGGLDGGEPGSHPWSKGMEKIVRRSDKDAGGTVLRSERDGLYAAGLPFYSESWKYLCHCVKVPAGWKLCVQSLAESSDQNLPEFHGIIRQVEVLGYEKSPEWKTDAEGLHVKTSGFYSEFPVVLKIVVS